jgi:hypothetical protein
LHTDRFPKVVENNEREGFLMQLIHYLVVLYSICFGASLIFFVTLWIVIFFHDNWKKIVDHYRHSPIEIEIEILEDIEETSKN